MNVLYLMPKVFLQWTGPGQGKFWSFTASIAIDLMEEFVPEKHPSPTPMALSLSLDNGDCPLQHQKQEHVWHSTSKGRDCCRAEFDLVCLGLGGHPNCSPPFVAAGSSGQFIYKQEQYKLHV